MINRTPAYGLPMPEENDNYSLAVVNEVTAKVDEALGMLKENKEDVATEFSQIGKQSISINNDFRINQQAQISYTEERSKKYTVDGFYVSGGTLTVAKAGITFLALSQYGLLAQIVEIPEHLMGKSASLVIDATGLAGKKIVLNGVYSGPLVEGINVFAGTLPNSSATVLMQFIDTSASGFTPATIRRLGLFLGKFNGFEPIDPAIELVRCQRYAINFVSYSRVPASHISGNYILVSVPLPTSLRIAPSLAALRCTAINSYGSTITALDSRSGAILSVASFAGSILTIKISTADGSNHNITYADVDFDGYLDANL